jgi:hypothetical protein
MNQIIESSNPSQPSISPAPVQEPVVPITPQPQPAHCRVVPVLVISLIASLGMTAFFAYQYVQCPTAADNLPGQNNTPSMAGDSQAQSPPGLAPNNKPAAEWKTAQFGGFSYVYPAGWHVAEIWPSNTQQGIIIAIDPNPISTAPRGGPFAAFMIEVINGVPNPNETLAEKKAAFNSDNYTDIVTEIIKSDHGPIYYYSGKMAGPYMQGDQIEEYIFSLNESESDPLNQQTVVASLVPNSSSEYSDLLRHIVLSIQE